MKEEVHTWTDGVNLVSMPKGKKPKGRQYYRTTGKTLDNRTALYDEIEKKLGCSRTLARTLSFPMIYGRSKKSNDEIIVEISKMLDRVRPAPQESYAEEFQAIPRFDRDNSGDHT